MLTATLKKVRAIDFPLVDRLDLVNVLFNCQNMRRKESRMQIINDLPTDVQKSRVRDDQIDIKDIRGIVDACLAHSGGLEKLLNIISYHENNSEQWQQVEICLERFLQSRHIVALNPEAEMQIEHLTSLIVAMQVHFNNVDLQEIYHASAPKLDFSEPIWHYPKDLNLAYTLDRVLHHLNVAPIARLKAPVPPILIFVERLASCIQGIQEQRTLNGWVDTWIDNKTVPTWQVKEEAITTLRKRLAEEADPITHLKEPFTPSLMIQLDPLDSQILNQFTVKAWLKYGQEETACQNLEVPKQYRICDCETILELIDILIDEDIDENSVIEFFLPCELFNLKVDEWKLPSEQGKTLGVLYRVVLRSSERFMKPISRAKGTWIENWMRIKNLHQEEDVIKWLSDVKDYDGDSIYYNLTREKKAILWLLVSPFTIDPGVKSKMFFNMLRAGTPIALWPKESSNGLEGEALKTLLSKSKLFDLPRLIFEQRREAANLLRDAELRGEDVENIHHPGRCFTLFWDDPTRMPLEYMQKFQATGIRR